MPDSPALSVSVGPLPKNLRPEASDAWEAHLYVFYVSRRLWEVHLHVFFVSWRLWEAHLYVFYVSGRVQRGPASNDAKTPGGSPS